MLCRIQTMKMVNGKPRYTGLFDVWVKTIQKEGVPGLWKGFSPYYMRMGPHTTLLLVFTEQFTYLYSVHILHNKAYNGLWLFCLVYIIVFVLILWYKYLHLRTSYLVILTINESLIYFYTNTFMIKLIFIICDKLIRTDN